MADPQLYHSSLKQHVVDKLLLFRVETGEKFFQTEMDTSRFLFASADL